MDAVPERQVGTRPRGRHPSHGLLTLLGGLMIVGEVFGPWLRPSSELNIAHSMAGIETMNGRMTLVLGVVLILVGLLITIRRPPADDLFLPTPGGSNRLAGDPGRISAR